MPDPTPAQNRSKRPLSPSAASPPRVRTGFASHSDKPFSKTPSASSMDGPATRAKMLKLDWDQRETLLKTLFDLHPSARESIAAILPSMTPSPSVISKSIYFVEEVTWCHEYLNDYNWPNNPKIPAEGSCQGAAAVLNHAANDIDHQFLSSTYKDSIFREYGCTEAEYSMDASIALLEIILLAFERRNRQSRLEPEHESICERIVDRRILPGLETKGRICEVEFSFYELGEVWQYWVLPRVPDGMADGIHSERSASPENDASPEEVADYLAVWEAWHIAIRYLTRDHKPHPLREILLKYIDLPPILPPPGPNDNVIPESDDWLRPCLERLAIDIVKGEMPDRRPGPVLDLGGMSIN